MCVYNVSEIKTLEEDTYFYKLVKKSILSTKIFTSMVNPEERDAQSMHFLLGTSLTYEINVPIESLFDFTEGMYCFVKEDDARQHLSFYSNTFTLNTRRIITVLVPKGTRVRWAYYFAPDFDNDPYTKPDLVLVEKLIPISMLPEKKFINKFTKKNTKNSRY